jgi:hypothetical protein
MYIAIKTYQWETFIRQQHLIVCCLMYSANIFMHIQDENKLNKHIKLYKNDRGTGQRFLSVHFEVYSIQHYVIKFVRDLRQVDGFLWVLRFSPSINLFATIESSVKHHKPAKQSSDSLFLINSTIVCRKK